MLFKHIEEINMPSLMHCIVCDKPGILAYGLCNNCYERQKEDNKHFGGDTGIDADFEAQDTWEYEHDQINEIDDDGEPTTADEHNEEWLDENGPETET